MKLQAYLALLAFFLLLFLPLLALADCECGSNSKGSDRGKALRLKLITIASVLAAGAIGVCLPLLGRSVAALRSDKDVFLVIKAFAAGVILATGMLHILPDAFSSLTSPCLEPNPWRNFPFAGFVAMLSAIGTLIVDTIAMGYYKRHHFGKRQAVIDGRMEEEEEAREEHSGHVHVHTHPTHGHAHASGDSASSSVDLIRHRVVTQVPELENL